MKRTILAICLSAVILALAAFLSGCSKQQSQVVAKVGDRAIYADDITSIIDRSGYRFQSVVDELKARRELLDTLINQNLLIIGAYEHKLEGQEEVQRVIEGEKIKFLLDVLFERRILSKATPSEAEVKDWYTRMGAEIKASHILVNAEPTAQEVLKKIGEGVPFEQLALEYSIDPSAKRNQGDLGWFTWGSMVDNFQEAAFRLKPGEVSAPVKTDYGYHIIKVVDQRTVEHRSSYAETKDQISNLITERRKQTLMRAFADELKKKYPISVEKPTCDFVLNKLKFLYPDTIGTQPRWRNNIDPNQLSKEEKELVLGNYNGGQLSLGTYLTNLRRVPPDRQPDFDKVDSLAEVIFQMAFMDILALEAKGMDLENSKEYKDKLQRFKEMAMADVMRNDSIPYGAEIFEDETQKYYDTHTEEFTAPLRFHLIEVQVADEAAAGKLKSLLRTEQQFRDAAARETLRPGKRQVSGDLGIIFREQYPELYEAVANSSMGQVAGPIRTMGRYSVVYVAQRLEPELMPFNLAKGRIIDALTKAKGDSIYGEWIAAMRKRITVEVYDDVLAKTVDPEKYTKADTVQSK